MFQEICEMCGGAGLIAGSECICCKGTGIEVFAYPSSSGPDAGCNHDTRIIERGKAFCEDCGSPLSDRE